jgi:hypothetical protein
VTLIVINDDENMVKAMMRRNFFDKLPLKAAGKKFL